MDMKTILAPDVRTALRMVREQLGPDALVLSNRRVAEGVEILAAPATPRATTVVQALPCDPVPATPVPVVPVSVEPRFADVQNELRSMRSFLEARLAEMSNERAAYGPGVEGRAWRRLTRIGIPNPLVRELVAEIDSQASWAEAWSGVLAGLARGIGEAGDLLEDGGIFAFVGPTGAGKSTTLCKLAVRHALRHGPHGLVLISMDGLRLGGCDMLRAVARLLDVPFHAALNGESLPEMLARAGSARLVLVDTLGVNRKILEHNRLLESLGSLQGRVQTLLVLPANAQLSWLDSALEDYRASAPVAAVVTKLDETRSLGEVLGVVMRERLPLAYSTDGQEIPDDLSIASADALVVRAVLLDPEGEPVKPPAARATQNGTAAAAALIAARMAQ